MRELNFVRLPGMHCEIHTELNYKVQQMENLTYSLHEILHDEKETVNPAQKIKAKGKLKCKERTSGCAVEIYTIADGTSKHRGVKQG